jgi:hypothetical protein
MRETKMPIPSTDLKSDLSNTIQIISDKLGPLNLEVSSLLTKAQELLASQGALHKDAEVLTIIILSIEKLGESLDLSNGIEKVDENLLKSIFSLQEKAKNIYSKIKENRKQFQDNGKLNIPSDDDFQNKIIEIRDPIAFLKKQLNSVELKEITQQVEQHTKDLNLDSTPETWAKIVSNLSTKIIANTELKLATDKIKSCIKAYSILEETNVCLKSILSSAKENHDDLNKTFVAFESKQELLDNIDEMVLSVPHLRPVLNSGNVSQTSLFSDSPSLQAQATPVERNSPSSSYQQAPGLFSNSGGKKPVINKSNTEPSVKENACGCGPSSCSIM